MLKELVLCMCVCLPPVPTDKQLGSLFWLMNRAGVKRSQWSWQSASFWAHTLRQQWFVQSTEVQRLEARWMVVNLQVLFSLKETDRQILLALLEKEEEDQRRQSERRERAVADAAWMRRVIEEQLQLEKEREAELQIIFRCVCTSAVHRLKRMCVLNILACLAERVAVC